MPLPYRFAAAVLAGLPLGHRVLSDLGDHRQLLNRGQAGRYGDGGRYGLEFGGLEVRPLDVRRGCPDDLARIGRSYRRRRRQQQRPVEPRPRARSRPDNREPQIIPLKSDSCC